MSHDFIIQLQYQIAILQHLLEQMAENLKKENPTIEDALEMRKRINKQFEVTDQIVNKALLISNMRDKPVVSNN